MKPRKWFSVLLALTMILTLIPSNALAQIGPVTEPNFGFVPNSGEASVSKVDLVNMTEVARYYTEPRVSPTADYNWRTSRIAMDAEGNAWVLNTGADGVNLQGSVVRIQADTSELTTTHEYPDPVLAFGEDEAVTLFEVGATGDMPRAIAIDSEGYIWIGFYSSGELMKYSFNGTALTLEGTFSNGTNKLNFYEMKFAPDGTLYISSRNSTPARTGNPGVWSFDGTTFTEEWDTNPYALLIDPDSGDVYATNYSGKSLWIDDGINETTIAISTTDDLRGMAFDGDGKVWIASTFETSKGKNIYWYDPSDGTSGSIEIPDDYSGTTPVGVGMDASGLMWAICRTDLLPEGSLVGFNPGTKEFVGEIDVGFRPYAYGDFVVSQPPPRYGFCGYKLDADTGLGLSGWTIELYDHEGNLVDEAITDRDGKYCFSNLLAGTYTVEEFMKDGWEAVLPADGKLTITLPAALNLIDNGDFEQGNGIGFTSEYAYVDPSSSQATNPYNMLMGNEGTYTIGTNPFDYHDLWESYGDHTSGSGNMMIVNGEAASPGKIVWSDSVAVVQGTDYNFSFWGATSYLDAYSSLDVYINDEYIDTYDAPHFLAEWTKYETTWSSGDEVIAKIELINKIMDASGNDFALDDIVLTAHNTDFRNREMKYFDICGYKLDGDTDLGLDGWTIILEQKIDDNWVEIDSKVTTGGGKYCFKDLEAGKYRVSEELIPGWEQDFPDNNEHIVMLPDDASDCEADLENEDALFYNFVNGKLYDLCGHKYGVNWLDPESMDNPLDGWTITLLDSDKEYFDHVETLDGEYCFTGLRAGTYYVVESHGDLNDYGFWKNDNYWKPVDSDMIKVEIPKDVINEEEVLFTDFYNMCYTSETAWMFGDTSHIGLTGLRSNNWGWSQNLGELDEFEELRLPIYAGAGQNDTDKGYLVGYVDISWDEVEEEYVIDVVANEDVYLEGMKVWIGNTELPKTKKGAYTNAPGQLIVDPELDPTKEVFVAVHFEAFVPCEYSHQEIEIE